ncbi:MAG: hypothetical protein ACK5H2_06255 [Beutenbergiaceae bacterium]
MSGAYAAGLLIGFLLVIALPLAGGILLLMQGNKRRRLERERHQQWAMATGQPPSVNPEAEKAGRGMRVAGIILIAVVGLMILGRLATAANAGM